MSNLKFKTFLSDEGYGHIVRQRAIIEAMRSLHSGLDITIQTSRHLDAAKHLIKGVKAIDRYNNITWHKGHNGSPDLDLIFNEYETYFDRSVSFVENELAEWEGYDFLISDFVYEAFPLAMRQGVPAFGVAHFTWDWFFAKLYPPPISTKVMNSFFRMAKQATALYFPPFTPEEILRYYHENAIQVPLIMRSEINHKSTTPNSKFKVLIMDSGAGVLRQSILKAMKTVEELTDFEFFVSSNLEIEQNNISFIDKDELMVDYIGEMNLVIGRAGFNTISECIGLRTPMLLIGEAMNPEMNENILNLKREGLGTFISMETFETGLNEYLPHFLDHEYKSLLLNMQNHELPVDGAHVIANNILDRLQ